MAAIVLQGRPVAAELPRTARSTSFGDNPYEAARSRAGTTIGGWLTIRDWPSTCSASFDRACKLSRVRAFSAFFSARLSAFASLFFFSMLGTAAMISSSERCAYQMSIVRIWANPAIASR